MVQVTDSHGTSKYTGTMPDVIVGTFGKAFGVNRGFISSCQAVVVAVDICDSEKGLNLLEHLGNRVRQFCTGLETLVYKSTPRPYPW